MSYIGTASGDLLDFLKQHTLPKFLLNLRSIQSFENPIPVINEWSVLCSLKALKLSSCSGPDNIPISILKNCCDYLFYRLFILFDKSLNISYFPEIWKESYIISLHKSGNKNKISNY